MHLSVGRSMAMVSVATALRSAAGFVGHVRVGSKFSAAGVMRMSGAAAASQVPRASTAVPVLDAQAAELKAERLWGMADARKPVSMERKNGMPEMSMESVTARSVVDASGERGTNDFIEGQSETSALRRYQYTEQLAEDGDDQTDDDGNEYYI